MSVLLTTDFLIIGTGIIGLNIALNLVREYPDSKIILIDKEKKLGSHASGRNSGVLHAGFYYSADTLKAKFTREGNKMLTNYCLEKGLAINQCGKLVVAKDEKDLSGLDFLLKRGQANGIELKELDEKEVYEIEPRAKTFKKALFSPATSSVDPMEVMNSFYDELLSSDVECMQGVAYFGRSDKTIKTSIGNIEAGYVINCAGLYADRIARDFDFSKRYRILPFKGLYLYSNEPVNSLRTHIYPVPDLNNPFLGVHFTVTVDGHTKIGPTAIPAFWRENYQGFSQFKLDEFFEIIGTDISLMFSNDFGFKGLAFHEIQKYSKTRMANLASHLARGVNAEQYKKWGVPGIRAQLLDLDTRRLEMDFCYEGDAHSFHILNAVSPAFTCSMSFSHHVVEKIKELIH